MLVNGGQREEVRLVQDGIKVGDGVENSNRIAKGRDEAVMYWARTAFGMLLLGLSDMSAREVDVELDELANLGISSAI